nr:serine hydrolase domain-containing protein [Pseudoxanthomonas sp.]
MRPSSLPPAHPCRRAHRRAIGAVLPLAALLLLALSARAEEPDAGSRMSGDPLAALADGLRPNLLASGEPLPHWSLSARMAHHRVPGVAVAIIRGGRVVAAAGYGRLRADRDGAVDADTLFNVGSISKVVTASASLRLVAQGRLDLDRDVNQMLRSWQLPARQENPSTDGAPETVNLRMLMSHTAGLNVHGFPDYLPGEPTPTLLQTLEGQAPARTPAIRLRHRPGAMVDYSGGGTVIEQLMIEDVTGKPLEEAARAEVFAPLGMARSTFRDPGDAGRTNVAFAHGADGKPAALPWGWQRFPQQAPAGLWTSANDLGAFVGALIRSYHGREDYLPRTLAIRMMTEVAPGNFGLGPRLEGDGEQRVFHHGGSNDSYHAWIEGYLETGDGFVILTNGENGWALRGEIRNALSDAIGHGVNPLLRTVALDAASARFADYAGHYVRDTSLPEDLRGALADAFDDGAAELDIRFDGQDLSVALPDETGKLRALAPHRFIAPTVFSTCYTFHRDAEGQVRAMTLSLGDARTYYRRVPSH